MTPTATFDHHARRSLELAWLALRNGTLGIGAVLVDADGRVIAEGSNGIFAKAVAGPLHGTSIAHAEMNVLAQVAHHTDLARATLYTSLEPCAMCAGALVNANVAEVVVVAPDPLMHGLESMTERNDWIRERWAPRRFVDDDWACTLSLVFAFYLTAMFVPDHQVVPMIRSFDAGTGALLDELVADQTLMTMADAAASLDEVGEEMARRR